MGINDDPWPFSLLEDGTMEGFAPVWDYHENIDELKLKLLLELESLQNVKEELKRKDEETRRKDLEIQRKVEEIKRKDVAMQRMEQEMQRKDAEMRMKEEESHQLAQLLKTTSHERDVARDQLQMLLNNVTHLYSVAPVPLQTESPPQMMKQTRGSSSITESDSPSETHNNYHSFVSSPVDFDSISSHNLSNMNMAIHTFNTGVPYQKPFADLKSSTSTEMGDNGSWIISLAMQRALPEKGKLLQAVQAATQATPLLETLLMTGSLPEWRNPPPLLFPTAAVKQSHLMQSFPNGSHHEITRGGFHASKESPIFVARPCNNMSSAAKRQKAG